MQAAGSVLEYETVVREWTAAIKQGLARFHTEIKSEMAAARTFGQFRPFEPSCHRSGRKGSKRLNREFDSHRVLPVVRPIPLVSCSTSSVSRGRCHLRPTSHPTLVACICVTQRTCTSIGENNLFHRLESHS